MRLISYNIHQGIGGRDRRYQLERVLAVIDAERPDIICLQEVDQHALRTRGDDQAELIADYFQPAAASFQLTARFGAGGFGNLLLSRWPLEDVRQLSLSWRRKMARGAQLAIVRSPDGPFQLVHWHLGLGEFERHWQTRRLLEHPAFQAARKLPSLIVGDFNDWRNTLAAGPFAVHGFRQLTHPVSQFRSFPAFLPINALDKAFVRGAWEIDDVRIVRPRLALDASDHLPLVVDFRLPAPVEDFVPSRRADPFAVELTPFDAPHATCELGTA